MAKPAQTIIPHLWFEKEAHEAARFYVSIFPESNINENVVIFDTPSGDTETVYFNLWGHDFVAISGGPLFKFNPSVSFIVNFDSSREQDANQQLNEVWNRLSESGTVLMPLDKYPFSERYGWIQDKFGVSWHLTLSKGNERPTIVPSLLFAGEQSGRAEEAMQFYLSVFNNSRRGLVVRTPQEAEPDQPGKIMFANFMLENQWFAAMDGTKEHAFRFNGAISLMVYCDTQEQIDDYWYKLSAVPEAEQCGWLMDRFGLSWQIVPSGLDEMLSTGTPEQMARVTAAFLKMKKIDLAELKRARE